MSWRQRNRTNIRQTLPMVGVALLAAFILSGLGQAGPGSMVPFDAPVRSGDRVREADWAEETCPPWEEMEPAGPWWPPNQLGQVPILVYHEVSDREGRWSRHYDNFRSDLERLYEKGFRAVSMHDYLDGDMDIPAGTAPVVITFDDSTSGQFRLLEDGTVDPTSAVGIMLDFHREHPGFGLEATFYVIFPHPFRDPDNWERMLQMLVEYGMDVGNHTWTHADLSQVSPEEARRQLARPVAVMRELVPGYEMDTLALPFGLFSPDKSYLLEGEWEGVSYTNRALLLSGGNPALSPFDSRFDPYRIARIQATGPQLDLWFGYFENNPGLLYVSDGCPSRLTVPEDLGEQIHQDRAGDREIHLYPR